MSFGFRKPRGRLLIAAVATAVLAAVEGGVIAWVHGLERATLRSNEKTVRVIKAARPDPSHDWRQLNSPGIIEPPVATANRSVLDPDEPVIGVEVGGKVRAYRISALTNRDHHLVNDLLGGVPVSVAYCDLTDCVRVYTDRKQSRPLNILVAGLYDGEMIVTLGGNRFYHRSGIPFRPGATPAPVPYEQLTPTRTTWGEWKALYPDTEVYEGDPAAVGP